MTRETTRSLALAAAAFAVLAAPAGAVEERTLKFTHVFPATHWLQTEGIQPFVDRVTEASGGKIKFEIYPAGQLGKETTAIVTSGLAEMGLTNPSYEPEKLPLNGVLELPGFHKSSCEGARQYQELAKEGGPLYEMEYKPLGIRALTVMVLAPYEVQTSSKVIESVADMSGVKLRANGAMAKAVAALGGVPVQVTSNEFYDAVSRGTIDGGMWPTGSTRSAGMEDVLNHTVKGTAMGGGAPNFIISEEVFQSFDAESQKILTDAGNAVTQSLCEFMDTREAAEEKWLIENGKLTLHQLSDEEAAKWAEMISPVAEEWAADLNSTGRPGTEILEAFRAIAEKID